ncbi:MAG: DUF998 domain-containing protein [Gemmatimonas sp.]|nr:DUF998 domain-containing protein [Gemmatimonas sp.]
MTGMLLLFGTVTAAVFVAVLLAEGVRRPGYDPVYHTGSELSLGERGWVQIANFLQVGVGMLAFAAGVYLTLETTLGAVLLTIFGLGMIGAGMFLPDPIRGYPPGAPKGTPTAATRQHVAHGVIGGPVAFVAIFGACLVLAGQLDGSWRLYTILTAVAGLGLTIWTALAYQRDAPNTGLVQRALILVYLGWIVLLGIHLL